MRCHSTILTSYSYSLIILAYTYKLNMISVVLKDLKSLSQLCIQEETLLDKSHLLQMTLDMIYRLSELNLFISYGDPLRTRTLAVRGIHPAVQRNKDYS